MRNHGTLIRRNTKDPAIQGKRRSDGRGTLVNHQIAIERNEMKGATKPFVSVASARLTKNNIPHQKLLFSEIKNDMANATMEIVINADNVTSMIELPHRTKNKPEEASTIVEMKATRLFQTRNTNRKVVTRINNPEMMLGSLDDHSETLKI